MEKYKSYPSVAKRRRMEGTVKVRFTILKNGQVSNITVTGAKIFHGSARKAVKKAFPMNVKNIPISLPYTVNIPLQYQIR
ncbi:MAG: energy transducer TonB [Sulfurovum sp.]|nr:energy transducer TonB [Sulfurovum sp.]